MSQINIFNGNEQQLRAVFDLCGPNEDGLISLQTFQQLYEEYANGPSGKYQSLNELNNKVRNE